MKTRKYRMCNIYFCCYCCCYWTKLELNQTFNKFFFGVKFFFVYRLNWRLLSRNFFFWTSSSCLVFAKVIFLPFCFVKKGIRKIQQQTNNPINHRSLFPICFIISFHTKMTIDNNLFFQISMATSYTANIVSFSK